MIRRATLVVALLAAVAPATSRAASPVVLTGDVSLSATTSGSVLVRVPKPVTVSGEGSFDDLSVQQNPDISVTGRGRVVGLVLTQAVTADPRKADTATLAFLSYGMCTGRACAPDQPAQATLAYGRKVTHDDDTTIHLPAGTYRLYLVTDGAPVTARLRLHGLSGTSRLTPTDPTSATVVETTPDASGTQFVSGEFQRLPRAGFAAVSELVRSKVGSSISGGWCLVHRDAEDSAYTDAADGPTGCGSRVPDAVVQQNSGGEPDGFFGHGGHQGFFGLEDPPNGRITVASTLAGGSYRFDRDQQVTPAHEGASFTLLLLPWA